VEMKQASKSVRILDLIASKDGMRFTDIQRALWEMTYSHRPFTRDVRGYWCTNLLGGFDHAGLLSFYCIKCPDGLWRQHRPHSSKPWQFGKN